MDDRPPSLPLETSANPGDTGRDTAPGDEEDAAASLSEASAASHGGSARARATADALRALAHVSRSFVLYDAANERIRVFLEDVRSKVELLLSTHGDIALEVRPWDMVLDGEVVYTDKDRERSLSFRLYRDGVRRLTLRAELEWPELVLLIGILSIRFKGVRTQEDDIVTLLWRAEFKHIEIAAVEGVIANEEDPLDLQAGAAGAAGARDAMQAMIFAAPYAFTYPWPNLTERATVEHRPVPPELLVRIADEEGAAALPAECLQLVRAVLAGLSEANDPLALEEVTPVLREVCGFLVGDHCLDALAEVIHAVKGAPGLGDEARRELLGVCGDAEVVRRAVVAMDPAAATPPAALIELMALVPGDHLATLLELFTSGSRHRGSPAFARLLESQVKGQGGRLAEHLAGADAAATIDLFRILAGADPAGATEAALALVRRPEAEVQLEAVRRLAAVEYGGKVGRALVAALASSFAEVRAQALATLVRNREGRAFDAVAERTRRSAGELPVAEAKSSGEALALLDPVKARALFREWVRPQGLLGRLGPGQATLRWAAVAGLAHLPGGDSEELLVWLSRHAGEELARQSEAALAALRGGQGTRHG
jgi:hypothetical protein